MYSRKMCLYSGMGDCSLLSCSRNSLFSWVFRRRKYLPLFKRFSLMCELSSLAPYGGLQRDDDRLQ